MEFYNVKSRRKVQIDDKEIKKQKVVQSSGSVRYAVTAEDEGTRVFRFVSEAAWKALDVPEV